MVSADQLVRYHYFCGHLHSRLGRRETAREMFKIAIGYDGLCKNKPKARKIWESLTAAGRSDCGQYLKEAKRLCDVFRR